jgi:hypothetical protein
LRFNVDQFTDCRKLHKAVFNNLVEGFPCRSSNLGKQKQHH